MKHVRSDICRPSSDDWYPNAPDGTVKVTLASLSTGQWRVCVWGDDDTGMERDYHAEDRARAEVLFARLAGCSDVTKQLCRELGMTYA